MSHQQKLGVSKFLPSLWKYILIGGMASAIDISAFQSLVGINLYRPLAATIAYGMGVLCHFTLNKFLNFKNFNRSTAKQLRTYAIVMFFCWLTNLTTIEASIKILAVTPLWAKVIAIIINIPIGFLGNRYLTFGAGIRGTIQYWQRSRLKTRAGKR